MDTPVLIAVIVVAVLVLIALVLLVQRRRRSGSLKVTSAGNSSGPENGGDGR